MALDPKAQAALALHRFGFGPRAGSIAAIAADPRGALVAELDKPGAGQIDRPDLMTGAQASRAVFEYNSERLAKDRLERKRREAQKQRAAEAGMEEAAAKDAETEAQPKPDAEPPLPRRMFFQEAQARIDAAVAADIGFAERLVWFWSNHFCVSADKVPARPGGYERERIRAHVLGRFVDMLLAVESDPAMLIYLDNAQSIGPNSVAGINREKGLNENLARNPRAAYARRAHRLYPGRRDRLRQGSHRLDASAAGVGPGARRRVRLHQAAARAGAANGGRQGLRRRRRRAGAGGSA